MIHIIISVLLITICCLKGDRKNWRQYYPTILLFILGDAVYNFITHDYSLWVYSFPGWEALPHTVLDLYWAVVIFPCIVILFITFLPKGTLSPQKASRLPGGPIFKTAAYIAGWAAGFALVEYAMYLFAGMEYFHGWSTVHSFVFDIVMFTVLYVHYKKPVAAWLMIAALVPVFILVVGMPLSLIK